MNGGMNAYFLIGTSSKTAKHHGTVQLVLSTSSSLQSATPDEDSLQPLYKFKKQFKNEFKMAAESLQCVDERYHSQQVSSYVRTLSLVTRSATPIRLAHNTSATSKFSSVDAIINTGFSISGK